MTHLCHAISCKRQVKPSLLMCHRHWRMVPADLQSAIWKNYRKGQEKDKKPTEDYVRSQLAAINHVAAIEGNQLCNIDRRIAWLKSRGHFSQE